MYTSGAVASKRTIFSRVGEVFVDDTAVGKNGYLPCNAKEFSQLFFPLPLLSFHFAALRKDNMDQLGTIVAVLGTADLHAYISKTKISVTPEIRKGKSNYLILISSSRSIRYLEPHHLISYYSHCEIHIA